MPFRFEFRRIAFEFRRIARGVTIGAACIVAGCAAPATGGQRIEVATRISGDLGRGDSFENDFGWTLRLESARVAFEHLYFVTGESVGAAASLWDRLLPSAFAHPGHYDAGEVLAEVNESFEVDLLGEPLLLEESEALTGEARSAVITFGVLADREPVSGAEEPVAIVVEGSATLGDAMVQFRADVTTTELSNAVSDLPEVSGSPFEGALTGDGTVHGEVLTRVWLDQVEFAGFDPRATETVAFERGTEPQNAFVRGAKKALAYAFSFERNQ